MRRKNCVLLFAAGKRTQLFYLIFKEPGVHILGHSCTHNHMHLKDQKCLAQFIHLPCASEPLWLTSFGRTTSLVPQIVCRFTLYLLCYVFRTSQIDLACYRKLPQHACFAFVYFPTQSKHGVAQHSRSIHSTTKRRTNS